jgi:hypothetical protein
MAATHISAELSSNMSDETVSFHYAHNPHHITICSYVSNFCATNTMAKPAVTGVYTTKLPAPSYNCESWSLKLMEEIN